MKIKSGQEPGKIESVMENMTISENIRKLKRFEHNLAELSQGNLLVLQSDEFVGGLVEYLLGDTSEHKDVKRKVLINLGTAAVDDESKVRERSLTLLSIAGEHLQKSDEKSALLIIVHGLCKWLEHETELLPGMVVVVRRLEELVTWLLEKSFFKEAEKLLTLYHLIHNGSIVKGSAIKSLIGKTLENLATKEILERLTDGYLLADDNQPLFRNLLVFLKNKAVTYLVERISSSASRRERLALLDLVPAFGQNAVPIIIDSIQNNSSWAEIRNGICILADIPDNSSYATLRQYLSHPDRRVQHEMICYVVKLSGPQMNNRLMDALFIVNDDLKSHVVRLLVEREGLDDKALTDLYQNVENRGGFYSPIAKRLLNAIIAGVRSYPSTQHVVLLERLLAKYGKLPGNDELFLRVDEALKVIIPKLRHHQRADENKLDIAFQNDPTLSQLAQKKINLIEESVRKFLRNGDVKGAVHLLYTEALGAAKGRDFHVAERLRDRIMEIDPMALNQAVELGGLIDEMKGASITGHDIEVWSELYDELTTVEFEALYQSFRQIDFSKGDVIVSAGETDSNLYFLNTGYISLSCLSSGGERFLKKMGPGSILGSEQFFSTSVWTMTLKAFTAVQVQVLGHGQFLEMAEKMPELPNKLRGYCQKYEEVPDLLKMSGDDRRQFPRYSVAILSENTLLDPFGNKGKRNFNGEVIDISKGGIAFRIKISSHNNARLLLGRQIVAVIHKSKGVTLTQCCGVIVGVRPQDTELQTYTVHVKLSRQIDDQIFHQICCEQNESLKASL